MLPFMLGQAIVIALLVIFPSLALWLPNLVKGSQQGSVALLSNHQLPFVYGLPQTAVGPLAAAAQRGRVSLSDYNTPD